MSLFSFLLSPPLPFFLPIVPLPSSFLLSSLYLFLPFSPLLLSFFSLSHLSSSPLFFLSSLLSFVPANQSCTYLWKTIQLVLVKKEFCKKCFTFYMSTICLTKQIFFSSLVASMLSYSQSHSCIWQNLYNLFYFLFFFYLLAFGTLPVTQISYLNSQLTTPGTSLGFLNPNTFLLLLMTVCLVKSPTTCPP